MAKVDYVKINNTINYIQNVAYLSELPVANENSADFVSVNNELYVKQVNGTTYTYAKVGGSGGGGLTVLEKTLVGDVEIGAENLRFTEDFSLEDFDLLYNFQAIIRFDIDKGKGVSSLYLVPSEIGKGEGNATVNCLLDYAGMMIISVSLLLFQGALTYDISIIPIERGGSGGASEPTIINLNSYVPSTATNGTLDSSVLATLQASDSNYIVFNNEIFKLADKQHNEGYLVYSHNGHDTTGCFFQKCITITISTRGWVLESQENASKTYVSEQITSAYGFDVSVNGQTLVFNTIGDVLQGDY